MSFPLSPNALPVPEPFLPFSTSISNAEPEAEDDSHRKLVPFDPASARFNTLRSISADDGTVFEGVEGDDKVLILPFTHQPLWIQDRIAKLTPSETRFSGEEGENTTVVSFDPKSVNKVSDPLEGPML